MDGNMRAAYLVEVPFAKFRRAIDWGPTVRELPEDELPFAEQRPVCVGDADRINDGQA